MPYGGGDRPSTVNGVSVSALTGHGRKGRSWAYAVVAERSETLLHALAGVDVADEEDEEEESDQSAEDGPFDHVAGVGVAAPVAAVDVVTIVAASEWKARHDGMEILCVFGGDGSVRVFLRCSRGIEQFTEQRASCQDRRLEEESSEKGASEGA
jgi:hypothetical protein